MRRLGAALSDQTHHAHRRVVEERDEDEVFGDTPAPFAVGERFPVHSAAAEGGGLGAQRLQANTAKDFDVPGVQDANFDGCH